MPNVVDVIRRLAENVYTSPYDKTMDTAILAAVVAFEGSPSAELFAMPPREILKASLAAIEEVVNNALPPSENSEVSGG